MKKISRLPGPTLLEIKNRGISNHRSETKLQQELRELIDKGYVTVDDEGQIWLTDWSKEEPVKEGYTLHEENK